ncbi:MAG: guanosine monophosphate reductase [Candidatus Dojkabacteria bacterium]
MATILASPVYTFDDVLLRPQYSEVNSREEVDVSVEIVPGLKISAPIMSANMQSVNSIELGVKLSKAGGMATVDQFMSIEEEVKMIKAIKSKGGQIAGAIGSSRDYMERAEAIIDAGVDVVIMDSPHAHNLLAKNAIKDFRQKFGDSPLIVGNVATKEAALFLVHHGVDGIKVGVGPGAACTTRITTGSGAAQITAIMECFDVARNHGVSIIADGGVKTPGGFAKAIAAGGTAVYMGSIFAGTDEAPSKLVEINGVKYKEYYGSSSVTAKLKRAESDKSFREKANRFVEGDSGYTKYQGSVADLVEKYIMGLKSALSYTGAFNIKDFQTKSVFTIVTQNGLAENGAHGLIN